MALIDRLQRAGGILKQRAASATGALRTLAARVPAPIRRIARVGRLTSPLGLAITGATFAPQIIRGIRTLGQILGRGVAFFGGRQVVTAAGAGGVTGILIGRPKGDVTRPSDVAESGATPFGTRVPPSPPRRKRVTRRRAPKRRRAPIRAKPRRRRRIPAHRHRVVSVPVRRRKRKRATHRSPRHSGHKKVSFTTKDGRKVSFLANPRARHR